MPVLYLPWKRLLAVAAVCIFAVPAASADTGKQKGVDNEEDYHRSYIVGTPDDPAPAWELSRGGRLYDNWFATLDKDEPKSTHPLWPASNTKKKGAVTWRCKSCHGWDYRGRDGSYGEGSYKTGIRGVFGLAGTDIGAIMKKFMGRGHGFSSILTGEDARRLALFIAQGLHDTDRFIDRKTKAVKGNAGRGKAIFQTVCAACHGFDGRALNWGDDREPAYVGTEANANPWEVLHKIRNAHPGAEMVALRAFALADAVDVLAYAKTLPQQ